MRNHAQFARYLATVVKYARDRWNIPIQYIEPFNEPTPGVWLLYIPDHGWANQEGCNFPYPTQTSIINELYHALGDLAETVGIAVSDETGVPEAIATLGALAEDAAQPLRKIAKINVHGYSGTDTSPYRGPYRPALRALWRIKAPTAKMWLSEFGDGDPSGMTMATSIMLDMTELQPSAWVQWQVIDPAWGFFANPDPQKGGVIGPVYPKYYVFAQFSRHVRRGCGIIGNSDPNSIVAYNPETQKLIIVTLNLDKPRWVSYDLSALTQVAGPIDRWETVTLGAHTAKGYVHTTDTILTGKAFRFRCEANAVYTFEISGISF